MTAIDTPRLQVGETIYANGLNGWVTNPDAEARTLEAVVERPSMAVQLQAKRVGDLPQAVHLEPPCFPPAGGRELAFNLRWGLRGRDPLDGV